MKKKNATKTVMALVLIVGVMAVSAFAVYRGAGVILSAGVPWATAKLEIQSPEQQGRGTQQSTAYDPYSSLINIDGEGNVVTLENSNIKGPRGLTFKGKHNRFDMNGVDTDGSTGTAPVEPPSQSSRQ